MNFWFRTHLVDYFSDIGLVKIKRTFPVNPPEFTVFIPKLSRIGGEVMTGSLTSNDVVKKTPGDTQTCTRESE